MQKYFAVMVCTGQHCRLSICSYLDWEFEKYRIWDQQACLVCSVWGLVSVHVTSQQLIISFSNFAKPVAIRLTKENLHDFSFCLQISCFLLKLKSNENSQEISEELLGYLTEHIWWMLSPNGLFGWLVGWLVYLKYLESEVRWQKIRRGVSLKFEVELAQSSFPLSYSSFSSLSPPFSSFSSYPTNSS